MEDKIIYVVKFDNKIVLQTYDKKEAYDYCFTKLKYGHMSTIFANGDIIWQGRKY